MTSEKVEELKNGLKEKGYSQKAADEIAKWYD
jgi:hypothetical protein